jgi:hypothetical protein
MGWRIRLPARSVRYADSFCLTERAHYRKKPS